MHPMNSEIERLRRLHRGTSAGLTALRVLRERTPDDELRLSALAKLEQRLSDRIERIESESSTYH